MSLTECVFVCLFMEDVALVELMYLVFTRMPGESDHKYLGSLLLCLCDILLLSTNFLVLVLFVYFWSVFIHIMRERESVCV